MNLTTEALAQRISESLDQATPEEKAEIRNERKTLTRDKLQFTHEDVALLKDMGIGGVEGFDIRAWIVPHFRHHNPYGWDNFKSRDAVIRWASKYANPGDVLKIRYPDNHHTEEIQWQ
jgi:hypothetical protein